MKKSLRIFSIALLAGLFMSFNQPAFVLEQDDKGKEVTLKGGIVDAHCYLSSGAKATKENAKCFNECIDKGVPPGFLSEDGQFYLLLDERKVSLKDQIAGMASIPIYLTGTIIDRNGVKAILLRSIERVQ